MTFKNMNLPTLLLLTVMFLSWQESGFLTIRGGGNQIDNLNKLIDSRKSENTPSSEPWPDLDVAVETLPPVYTSPQDGLMKANKIGVLPGQPEGVDFDQYAGYVTLDPHVGKALFYYFVESPQNSSTKPLVLWLNGGPGCSSLGYGAMEELGPFRVKSNGRTLYRNNYSWNEVANVIFLESPATVGFSYSNKTYSLNDKITAVESYTFLVNWFERFPHYKNRDFYITGESYAGHYGPQLAHNILAYNKKSSEHFINLKGIAIGNAYVDRIHTTKGKYDFFWTHSLNSDETHARIEKYCDYRTGNFSTPSCNKYRYRARQEIGVIDVYNIYAPICNRRKSSGSTSAAEVEEFDACSSDYVYSYLNRAEVQQALHTRPNAHWGFCSLVEFGGISDTVLPLIKQLMATGIRIWLFSGDVDAVVSVTATRYSINSLNLPIETAWRAWYSNKEVGGHVIGYKGLALVTVRGAGHQVPSYQPERALTMISSFLRGELPPKF